MTKTAQSLRPTILPIPLSRRSVPFSLRGIYALGLAVCLGWLCEGWEFPHVHAQELPANAGSLVFSPYRHFLVPFEVDTESTADAPKSVLLFASRDQGKAWKLVETVDPEQGHFSFVAAEDGEYWFSLRTVDQQGNFQPSGPHQPEKRVLVDSREPEIKLDAWQNTDGEVQVLWEIRDQLPARDRLSLEYRWDERNAVWQSIAIDPNALELEEKYLRGQIVLPLLQGTGSLQVRLAAADRLGNAAVADSKLYVRTRPLNASAEKASFQASEMPNLSALGEAEVPTSMQTTASKEEGPTQQASGDLQMRLVSPQQGKTPSKTATPSPVSQVAKPTSTRESGSDLKLSAPAARPRQEAPPARQVSQVTESSPQTATKPQRLSIPLSSRESSPQSPATAPRVAQPQRTPEFGPTPRPTPQRVASQPVGGPYPAMRPRPQTEQAVSPLPQPRSQPTRTPPVTAQQPENPGVIQSQQTADPERVKRLQRILSGQVPSAPSTAPQTRPPVNPKQVVSAPQRVATPARQPSDFTLPPASRTSLEDERWNELQSIIAQREGSRLDPPKPGELVGPNGNPARVALQRLGRPAPRVAQSPELAPPRPQAFTPEVRPVQHRFTMLQQPNSNNQDVELLPAPGNNQAPGAPGVPQDPNLQPMDPMGPTPQESEELEMEDQGGIVDPQLPVPPEIRDNFNRNVLLRAARNAVAIGDLDEALDRFELLLERFPEDIEARSEYAGVAVTAGEFELAVRQYEFLVERYPNESRLLTNLADVLVQVREYNRATEFLKRRLEQEPNDVETALKLARVYALNQQREAAQEIYSLYLADIDRSDEEIRVALARLLLELKRGDEALDLFLFLRQRYPDDIQIAADLVRAYDLVGDYDRAAEVADEMASIAPSNSGVRLLLAENFLTPLRQDVALIVLAQVLDYDPDNIDALINTARIHIQGFTPQESFDVLGRVPAAQRNQSFLETLAATHVISGEYADARIIYQRLLDMNPDDDEIMSALADTIRAGGEYEKAKAHYIKSVELNSNNREARVRLAEVLAVQRRFHESNAVLEEMLREDPSEIHPLRILVQNMVEMGLAGDAEALLHARRQQGTRELYEQADLHLAFGYVFRKMNKPLEAIYEYQGCLALPRQGNRPEAYYGLYAAYNQLNNPVRASEAIAQGIEHEDTHPTYFRIRVADLAAEDCDYKLAKQMMSEVVQRTPRNTSAGVRLAEAVSGLVDCHCNHDAVAAFRTLLSFSPSNIRGRIGLARRFAADFMYAHAVVEYDLLSEHLPEYLPSRREKAYAIQQWKGYRASHHAFEEALRVAEWGSMIYPANEENALDERPRPTYPTGYTAAPQEMAFVQTEMLARNYRDWRPHLAIPVYHSLIEMEQDNVWARFDVAQTHSGLNDTRVAMREYAKLLEVSPCNDVAHIALQRNRLELRPQSHSQVEFFSQQGRDLLAQIKKTKLTTSAILPYGNEDDIVMASYSHLILDPIDDPDLHGNIFTGRYQGEPIACWPWLRYYGQVNIEVYENRQSTRPTFDTGLELTTKWNTKLGAGLMLENVQENNESLNQDIYRFGFRLDMRSKPTRRWDSYMAYRYWDYSDNNHRTDFMFYNDFMITRAPNELKFLINYDFYGFREETIFSPDPTTLAGGTIHPYFSPSDFSQLALLFQFKQWVSEYFFKGANETWWQIQAGGAWDSDSEFYSLFKASLHHDVTCKFSSEMGMSLNNSQFYENVYAYWWMTYRFP
ncbi:Hypothetical protein PBC10988_29160 [Planctomycetales bacterium 10988]|nr:Hypothetical protein PBC10988_29160 [Planctomycetales bacterium 10988]